jgi:GxxExxY protein
MTSQIDTNEVYPFKQECYDIVGCCMEVHKTLGHGFLEPVYQEALTYEFTDQQIPYYKEKVLNIRYKDIFLDKRYIADFLCFDEIILEIKAIDELNKEHTAQVLNYLKATGKKLGILVNFGAPSLQFKRIIL